MSIWVGVKNDGIERVSSSLQHILYTKGDVDDDVDDDDHDDNDGDESMMMMMMMMILLTTVRKFCFEFPLRESNERKTDQQDSLQHPPSENS